jgi:hypothetical protein
VIHQPGARFGVSSKTSQTTHGVCEMLGCHVAVAENHLQVICAPATLPARQGQHLPLYIGLRTYVSNCGTESCQSSRNTRNAASAFAFNGT